MRVPSDCRCRSGSAASNAVHQHRVDVECGEPEELLHDVDHSLQPCLVHAADRPGADRVAVQGHDRCGCRGQPTARPLSAGSPTDSPTRLALTSSMVQGRTDRARDLRP